MDVLHRCSQNNLPRMKCSFWKAKSITHHLQTVKCHEDRFSGLVVVPRELLLNWNGNMRKNAKIIGGRLKNYHLHHYQRGGRSRCFGVCEAMTRLRRTWTVKRARCSAVTRAQETGFALLDISVKNEPQRWDTAFSCENLLRGQFPTTSDFCLL